MLITEQCYKCSMSYNFKKCLAQSRAYRKHIRSNCRKGSQSLTTNLVVPVCSHAYKLCILTESQVFASLSTLHGFSSQEDRTSQQFDLSLLLMQFSLASRDVKRSPLIQNICNAYTAILDNLDSFSHHHYSPYTL